jgi:hypothetical protein
MATLESRVKRLEMEQKRHGVKLKSHGKRLDRVENTLSAIVKGKYYD